MEQILLFSPEQVIPFPLYPRWQLHVNVPGLFMHIAFVLQLCIPSTHSSRSVRYNAFESLYSIIERILQYDTSLYWQELNEKNHRIISDDVQSERYVLVRFFINVFYLDWMLLLGLMKMIEGNCI